MPYLKKIPEAINNSFKKHWFWYTLIITFPTAWFSVILPYFGERFKLQIDNELTGSGTVISCVIVIVVAVIVFINNWYSSKSEQGKLEDLQGEVEYLGIINENVDRICDEKYDQLRKVIIETKQKNRTSPEIISKPNNQLKRIVKAITSCLVKFMKTPGTDYSFKDFLVTIAYNFPLETEKWEWVDGAIERDLTLDELLEDGCDSTFRYLMSSNQPYYFNNKKEDAKRERRYHYNKQDELNAENNEPVGSIFCYNFKIKKGNSVYVNAYLSISTNKKRFSEDDENICKNTRDNMVSLVKDTFGKRIGIELSLLYLEYLKEHNNEI